MRQFVFSVALLFVMGLAGCASPLTVEKPTATRPLPNPARETATAVPQPTPTSQPITQPAAYTLFSINVQDFSYPAESAAVLDKIITLHEETAVPVDIYLTDTMAQIYADEYPELLARLQNSPVVAVSYHIRLPRPYANQNDWLGMAEMSAAEMRETILRYETHAVDPATGETTDAPGGYQQVAALIGYPPYAASALSGSREVNTAARQTFRDLGAQMTVTHGGSSALGEKLDGLWLRPEQVDYKLFEHVGEEAGEAFETALAAALDNRQGDEPVFIGVKMHDNDFFATQSAWVTIYAQDRKRPPWNPTLQAPLLPPEEREAVWSLYEATVRHAAAQGGRALPVNLPQVLAMVDGR
ncbi:MAG TPA: hypothetical protein ENK32_01865 [Anaerolineae bacterium]|nr:hypothetical protein [Anaerolineae bacterium]